jgi:hypothetical protein
MSKNGGKKEFEVSHNGADGFQVEWNGILLTVQLNAHHGISGSIAEKDGKKVKLLAFHGSGPAAPFPVHLHEDTMDG